MAGAILGMVFDNPPSGEIQDKDYIIQEAERLHRISKGQHVSNFHYPDLIYWSPPKTQQDAVVAVDGRLSVLGLGEIKAEGNIYCPRKADAVVWQEIALHLVRQL